jgi:carbamoyltransferase
VPQLRVEHALCHAAAAYYCSPFDEAAILVVDGHRREQGATPSSHSVWIGWNGRIEPVMRSASCGIGALYEAVTVAIGFGAHETGKTMGLAPYGDDAAAPDLGGRLDGLAVDYGARCDADGARLFGLSPLAGATDDESLAARAALARAAQRECERAMLHLARAVREMTGMRRLCLAGEVSLNGRANDLVWRDAGFDAVFAGPAGADCGTSLGAALWGYHGVQGVPFRPDRFLRTADARTAMRTWTPRSPHCPIARATATRAARSTNWPNARRRCWPPGSASRCTPGAPRWARARSAIARC